MASSPPPLPPESSDSARAELLQASLPSDLALHIAALLPVRDLCSLGSCSRHLRELCGSDCLWSELSRRRWPSLVAVSFAGGGGAGQGESPSPSLPLVQGWKNIYISRHKDAAARVSTVVDLIKQCSEKGSLEVGDYLKGVESLTLMGLEFEDVKLFLFTAKQSVLINMIGMHYSMFSFGMSGNDVIEALNCCHVAQREVCVFSFRLGRWFFGFRLPDERSFRKVSLRELATPKEDALRCILHRGAVHEVLRVQISPATVAACSSSML